MSCSASVLRLAPRRPPTGRQAPGVVPTTVPRGTAPSSDVQARHRRKGEPMVTIAVLSHKGGVGKTVTVTNLGVCLAERGQRVLMVDFDPQADLSASWGLEDDEPHPRVEQYLGVANGDVGAALFEIPLGNDGRLALLPTAYEA